MTADKESRKKRDKRRSHKGEDDCEQTPEPSTAAQREVDMLSKRREKP